MKKQLFCCCSLVVAASLAVPAFAQVTGPDDQTGPERVEPTDRGIADGDRMLGNRDDSQTRQLSNSADEAKCKAIFDDIKRSPETATDKLFVLNTSMCNQMEIEYSRLIESKSNDAQIKELARMIRADHESAQEKLMTIARGMNLDLPTGLPKDQVAFFEVLGSLPSETLDSNYLMCQKAGHAMAITSFTDHQAEVKDDALKGYISEVLPKLREHGRHVVQLAAAKDVGSGSVALGDWNNNAGALGNVDQSQNRTMDATPNTDTNRKPTDTTPPR